MDLISFLTADRVKKVHTAFNTLITKHLKNKVLILISFIQTFNLCVSAFVKQYPSSPYTTLFEF